MRSDGRAGSWVVPVGGRGAGAVGWPVTLQPNSLWTHGWPTLLDS